MACPVGCQTCTSIASCQSCTVGYYLSGSTCSACNANCLECSSTGCSKCAIGSTLIGIVCFLCTDGSKSGTPGCM